MGEEHAWWETLLLPRLDHELHQSWALVLLERFFRIRERKTTLLREVAGGGVHFVCTAFILAVNPTLLSYAGVDARQCAVATALSTGVACIVSGCSTNLPFILAPTTATSLYFGLVIQNHGDTTFACGNTAVLLLGLLLIVSSLNSFSRVLSTLIPFTIKVGAILGISLLVSLEALCQLKVVQAGTRTVLTSGAFTPEVYIAFTAFITIAVCLHHRLKGAFFIGILVATLLFCIYDTSSPRAWPPSKLFALPTDLPSAVRLDGFSASLTYRLCFDLLVISFILIEGLGSGLAETAQEEEEKGGEGGGEKRQQKEKEEAEEEGREQEVSSRTDSAAFQWLYVSIGVGSVLSALLSSGPILLSPESAPGIRAGSRTGLSAVVCGCLYLLSIPFAPLFASLPVSSTSPVLITVALMLFENSSKIKWSAVREGAVVFAMMISICFTYSILSGVALGLTLYLVLAVATDYAPHLKKARRVARLVWRALARLDRGGGRGKGGALQDGLIDVEYSGVAGDKATRGGDSEEVDDDDDDDDDDVEKDDDEGPKILSFQLNEIGSAKKKGASGGRSTPPSFSSPGGRPEDTPSSPTPTSFEEYRRQRRLQMRAAR